MRDIIYNKGEHLKQNFPSQWLSLEPQGPFLAFPHECSCNSKERLLTQSSPTGSDLGEAVTVP